MFYSHRNLYKFRSYTRTKVLVFQSNQYQGKSPDSVIPVSNVSVSFRRHRCIHETTENITTISTDDTFSEVISAYKTDFDKKKTNIRAEIKRPTDNLKPEGDFDRPEKEKFRPAEKPIAHRPHDNLIVPSGDFYGKYHKYKKPSESVEFVFF